MLTLMNCCQGLSTLDREALAMRMIHFALQEYLSAHPDIFSKPHLAMAQICLTDLNFQHAKAPLTTHSPDTLNTPFLEYSVWSECEQ